MYEARASNPSVQLSGQDDGRRCLGRVRQKNHRQHLLRLQDSHNDNHSCGFSEHDRRRSLLTLPPHTRHEKTRETESLDELRRVQGIVQQLSGLSTSQKQGRKRQQQVLKTITTLVCY